MRSARALEAILFAAGDSVETERIAKVLGAEPWDVRQAAEQLAREYEENGRGFRLARMENRLQLVTAGEYSDVVSRTLEKRAQPKLSPTALEVLAIVAYYQPVTRSYIEQLRGTAQLLYRRAPLRTWADRSLRTSGGAGTAGSLRDDRSVSPRCRHFLYRGAAAAAECRHGRGNTGTPGRH